MIKKNNRTCQMCGKKYTYCPSCDEFINLPTWMVMWCSENCKNVYDIASSLLNNHITEEEARERFDKCDLTGKDHFSIKSQLAISMAYESKKDRMQDKEKTEKNEDIKETAVVESAVKEAPESGKGRSSTGTKKSKKNRNLNRD